MHRRNRQATLGQKIYKGMEIVDLAHGNLVSRKHRFDAFLDRLLRVEADDRIVDLAIWNQLSEGLDVPIRQFKKTASRSAGRLIKDLAFAKRPIESGAGKSAPIRDFAFRANHDIHGQADIPDRLTQPSHFLDLGGYTRLDD